MTFLIFFHQSIPSVSEIYSMLHSSSPDNASSALLQLHTAPNCQYKVFHPHFLVFSKVNLSVRELTLYFFFFLYRCLFGLRFPKCLGRCAYIVVFHLECCSSFNLIVSLSFKRNCLFFRFCVSAVQFSLSTLL